MRRARRARLAPTLVPWLLVAGAALAGGHAGPPFPIVEDRSVGPYTVSIWTDPDATARLELFMRYAPDQGLLDVPDPWYGDNAAFERAHDLIEAGVAGLVANLLDSWPAAAGSRSGR